MTEPATYARLMAEVSADLHRLRGMARAAEGLSESLLDRAADRDLSDAAYQGLHWLAEELSAGIGKLIEKLAELDQHRLTDGR